ncbi:uncharacterized protein LOC131177699 [Hevea brasiliensis]|uniref:uncharacterized protein LOC131177699 n=1 Tax=Hevea brasiliensis TaxID=3981 RepID=UPI0025EBD774|nr:uncharacterized protein LOC131177699 [Hevea brasiliensis]
MEKRQLLESSCFTGHAALDTGKGLTGSDHCAVSGSIYETLPLHKPLIVVMNDNLMENHQSVLPEELAGRKHFYRTSPKTLHHKIADMDFESLIPYPAGDATPVAKLIHRFLGFPDD